MTSTLGHVENPSDRITIQQVPKSAPGQCGICGNGKDPDGFVDPRLDFEYWGALIFCRTCTLQMAAIYGFISPETYEETIGEVGLLQLQVNELRENNAKLEGVVSGLTGYWNNRSDSPITPVMDPAPSIPSVEQETKPTSESDSDPVSNTERIDERPVSEPKSVAKPIQF